MKIQEIWNQQWHAKKLKDEMQVAYAELDPERWAEQRAYIATCEYHNRTGPGTWTEGIDYVVLDEDNIAWRLSGDHRDNGDWAITDPDEFVKAVIEDAEEFLATWKDEMEGRVK